MTEYSRLPIEATKTLELHYTKFDFVTGMIVEGEVAGTVRYIIRGDFEPLFFEDGQYAGYMNDERIVISDDKRATREHFIDAAKDVDDS